MKFVGLCVVFFYGVVFISLIYFACSIEKERLKCMQETIKTQPLETAKEVCK